MTEDKKTDKNNFLSLFNKKDELLIGLAPMAGTSTPPYRGLVSSLSASFTITELVSARGIVYNPDMEKVRRYLQADSEEGPHAIQLFGHDPKDFAQAITIVLSHPEYAGTDWIDINMGCPVKKVCGTGAGAALMLKPDLAAAIASAAVEAAGRFGKAVTVKMRSGWDQQNLNAPALAHRLEREGVAAVTVHARSREMFYSGRADWQMLYLVREACDLPLCGNGDIKSAEDIRRLAELADLQAYQIGRAALGNPFIFEQVRKGLADKDADLRISTKRWLSAILQHFDGMIELLGETAACREMRSQFAYYLRSFKNAAEYRERLMRVGDRTAAVKILTEASESRALHLNI